MAEETTQHVATCRTLGCENEGFGIELIMPTPVVVCGGCNEQITDIEPPIPDNPEYPDDLEFDII